MKFDYFIFKIVNDKGAGLGLFFLACNKVGLSCVKTKLEQFASEQWNQLNALKWKGDSQFSSHLDCNS